jgi:molecular chaperone Hsp33
MCDQSLLANLGVSMLTNSRIFSFMDHNKEFVIHFFEGQKLIHDLILAQKLSPDNFLFLRDSVLSLLHTVNFLKPLEAFGIYLDSSDQSLKVKIEISNSGTMRAVVFPKNFQSSNNSAGTNRPKFQGRLRTSKLTPNEKAPYNTILEVPEIPFSDLANVLFKESYQFESRIIISPTSDQSVMLLKLPRSEIKEISDHRNSTSLNDFELSLRPIYEDLFHVGVQDYEIISQKFINHSFEFLGSKEITFQCHCERSRFFDALFNITLSQGVHHLFDEGQTTIETECDYCGKTYGFSRDEFLINGKH